MVKLIGTTLVLFTVKSFSSIEGNTSGQKLKSIVKNCQNASFHKKNGLQGKMSYLVVNIFCLTGPGILPELWKQCTRKNFTFFFSVLQ
jgi:hypothetical protein